MAACVFCALFVCVCVLVLFKRVCAVCLRAAVSYGVVWCDLRIVFAVFVCGVFNTCVVCVRITV